MSSKRLRLLLDGDMFCWQRNGGISRLFQRTLPEMAAVDTSLDIQVVLPGQVNTLVPEGPRITVSNLPRIAANRRPWRMRQSIQKWMPPLQRLYWRTRKCDVFMSTYYTTPPVRVPNVVVAYDMIHEKYPDQFCQFGGEATIRQKKIALDHATMIIAISRQTQSDLEAYLQIPRERCRVVYPASGMEGVSPMEVSERGPFLLYVGDFIAPYKNFERMADAVLFSQDSFFRDLRLLVCSARVPDQKYLARYEREVADGRLVFRHVDSDAELAGLYNQCAAFVYPSIYEGFGIPVVEALQFGAPVACSRAASIPEAGGDAVTYFDPESTEDMRVAIRHAVSLGRPPIEVARRRQQAARFSWHKTAVGFLDAIRAVKG